MKKSWKYWLFIRIPFWFILTSLVLVTLLRWVPVRYTPLMLKRAFQFRQEENYHREQKWVSLEDISPELIYAVIYCEDQKFYKHHGFDWAEMKVMWRQHRQVNSPLRGCSTISQQTAKNVFTFSSPTVVRKVFEAWWTCLIEIIWGKNRILEVYLNVVELGKGIYGVGAGSEQYYGLQARDISPNQAVALAVCLPNPLISSPTSPTAHDRDRRSAIMERLDKCGFNDSMSLLKMENASEDYMREQRYVDAIHIFNKMEECYGHSDRLCFERAEAYKNLGIYDRAIEDIKAGMGKDQESYGLILLGDCYRLAGQYDDAINEFTKAIRMSPGDFFPYYRRGWCFELKGDKTKAMADYNRAIKKCDMYAYSYLMRGELLLGQGKVDDANKDFERVLELDQRCKDGTCRQYALHFLGRDDEAEEWMNQLISLEPDNCGHYYDQACLYARMGKLSLSIGALRKAFEKGYRSFAHVENDDDLDPIKENKEFIEMIGQYKSQHETYLRENEF